MTTTASAGAVTAAATAAAATAAAATATAAAVDKKLLFKPPEPEQPE